MLAQPGSRIRNQRAVAYTAQGENHEGTLGCYVRREQEPGLFLLSAAHVIALNGWARRDDIIEYLDADTGAWVEFARFVDWIRFQGPDDIHTMDAALARVTRDDLVSVKVKGLDIVPAYPNPAPAEDMPVRLYGASSLLVTDARIYSTGSFVPVTYGGFNGSSPTRLKFSGQILYGRQIAAGVMQPATQGGDSGALVIDALNFVVGLHIARTSPENTVDASVCTPIGPILKHFAARLATADPHAPATVRGASLAPALASTDDESPEELANRIVRSSTQVLGESIWHLFKPHRVFADSVTWMMTPRGLEVEGKLERTVGKPMTVQRIWEAYGTHITQCAEQYRVPAELIVATICTESQGNPDAIRREPGWVSDETTKNKVSVGLMQTLISSAEEALGRPGMTVAMLRDPAASIKAGTAFIHNQRHRTHLDPPLVACAYNAGSIHYNAGAGNRWRLRQYPIGTANHADRYVAWFNDCLGYFQSRAEQGDAVPTVSFSAITRL